MAYFVGIVASTSSTYILFLAFTIKSAPDAVGLFALLSAVVGVMVQFLDGVSSQRITQVRSDLSSIGVDRDGSVNFLNVGRLLVLLPIALIAVAIYHANDPDVASALGVLILGQGAYAFSVSTRIFSSSPRSVVALQLFNFCVFVSTAALVLQSNVTIPAASLLYMNGAASLLSAMPFLTVDIVRRCGLRHSFGSEFRLLYLSNSWRNVWLLFAYQGVNALGGAIDTLLTSLGGFRTAAEYQVVRRPMLALSSLNVALGQSAINKYSRGASTDWRAPFLRLLPVLIAWPVLGIIGLIFVDLLTPSEYEISLVGGVLLASSFAVGAFLQISGIIILVRMQTIFLLLSSLLRVLVLVCAAALTVPAMGVVGIGLSMVIANLAMLSAHVSILIIGDRSQRLDEVPVSA